MGAEDEAAELSTACANADVGAVFAFDDDELAFSDDFDSLLDLPKMESVFRFCVFSARASALAASSSSCFLLNSFFASRLEGVVGESDFFAFFSFSFFSFLSFLSFFASDFLSFLLLEAAKALETVEPAEGSITFGAACSAAGGALELFAALDGVVGARLRFDICTATASRKAAPSAVEMVFLGRTVAYPIDPRRECGVLDSLGLGAVSGDLTSLEGSADMTESFSATALRVIVLRRIVFVFNGEGAAAP